jgi:magnesium-transporting ATPase (P-type)
MCSGTEVDAGQAASLQALLEGSLLCNDSALSKDDATGQYIPNGAPTEVSLITAAVKAGLQPDAVKQAKPRVASVPFESEHKVRGRCTCLCWQHSWCCFGGALSCASK